MTATQRMAAREWVMLLALSLLWGGSFFFNGIAVQALPPLTIVALRVGLGALALLAVLRLSGLALPGMGPVWLAFLGMGVLNNLIPFCLIVWGQTRIGAGLASILNATTPLFAVLVAHVLTVDEKITRARLAGLLAGFLGVAVMIGPMALQGLGRDLAAQLAVLGAAVSYAFAGVFGRRFKAMGVAPLVTAGGQVTASSLMLVPLALAFDRPWQLVLPAWPVWAAILGLALLSTALAYVLFFRILAAAGATNIALVTFLIPVSAILLGALILGEQLAFRQVAGMGLIALGLAAIDGRIFGLFRRRPSPATPL